MLLRCKGEVFEGTLTLLSPCLHIYQSHDVAVMFVHEIMLLSLGAWRRVGEGPGF